MSLNEIICIYDELDRLTAVVDPAGETAIYTYDAVGNLLSIERQSASVVSIIEFTPKSAPVGTSVTIQGTGFSETPGENTVTFNGVPAAVISATATRIVTTVPPGAASGLITITTPTGSATSTTPFTVTAAPETPAIAAFSPTIGVPGTAVTITGTHFDTKLANNKVMFNRVLAVLSSATTTTIETAVPPGPGSGRIAVSTPLGTVLSSEDFFIPPSPRTVADVEFTGRVAFGESEAVTISTPNKIALVVFDGTAGRRVSVGVSEVSFAGVGLIEVSILGPYGATLANELVGSSGDDIDMEPLPDTGTYTIVADPGALTGSLTLTVSEPVTGTITINGPSVPVTIDRHGQDARLTFEGTAGRRVSLGVSGGAGVVGVSILRPDGTTLASKFVASRGDDIDTAPLPDTGTYTILIDPPQAKTVSLTSTLSEPVTSTITIGGPPVPVTIDRTGQDARVTFEGTAGQRVDLGVSEVSFGTGVGAVEVSILHPDGTTLASKFVFSNGRGIHPDPLPDTGTYTIVVDPQDAKTVSLTLTLSEPVTGTITIDGPSVPVTLRPGQKARLTFEGTTGQRASLGVTEVSFGTANGVVISISILKPDETALVSTTMGTSGGDLDIDPLADTGTHTIVVDPGGSSFIPGATTASLTLILSEPVSGTITIGGSSVPITLDRPGQNARLTFEGTAGQRVSVGVSEVSFDIEGGVTGGKVSMLRPDGTTLASNFIGTGGSDIDPEPLPETGTYTIVVNPSGILTVKLTLTLSEPVTGTVTIDGPPVAVTLNRPGQDARLTFEGTAGQRVRLRVSEVSFEISFAVVRVSVLNPEETTLASTTMDANGGDIDPDPLPGTGIYTVVVNPQQTRTASLSLTLSQVVP